MFTESLSLCHLTRNHKRLSLPSTNIWSCRLYTIYGDRRLCLSKLKVGLYFSNRQFTTYDADTTQLHRRCELAKNKTEIEPCRHR